MKTTKNFTIDAENYEWLQEQGNMSGVVNDLITDAREKDEGGEVRLQPCEKHKISYTVKLAECPLCKREKEEAQQNLVEKEKTAAPTSDHKATTEPKTIACENCGNINREPFLTKHGKMFCEHYQHSISPSKVQQQETK